MKSIVRLLLFLFLLIVLFFGIWVFLKFQNEERNFVSTHQEVVEKIEAIGRLELVRMNVRDVMEHKLVRQWLPNASALLIINGEAAGCIDFQKMKPEDIVIEKDAIKIKLPQPELCYCKINHEKSRVYETKYDYFVTADLVDNAYQEAEKQLRKTVLESGILDQTKQNATLFLKPFFETLGYKSVEISF